MQRAPSRRSEGGEAVAEGSKDLRFGGLAVGGAGRETLAQELRAPHFGLDATSSVRAAPGPPDRPTDAQDVVADPVSRCDLFPGLAVAAGTPSPFAHTLDPGAVDPEVQRACARVMRVRDGQVARAPAKRTEVGQGRFSSASFSRLATKQVIWRSSSPNGSFRGAVRRTWLEPGRGALPLPARPKATPAATFGPARRSSGWR